MSPPSAFRSPRLAAAIICLAMTAAAPGLAVAAPGQADGERAVAIDRDVAEIGRAHV